MSNIILGFDMRVPDFGAPRDRVYSEAIRMCEWAETRGIDYINVMEHHGSDDGYMPAPFIFSAAVSARTRRLKVVLGCVLLPLHDPVKVAEQIAVTDIISNGRLLVALGAGYTVREFAMFKRSLRDRARAMDEGIPLILRALSGERFVEGGREVFVRPLPLQKPHEMILVAGGVPASVKRAARLGLGIMPMSDTLIALYQQECAKLGRKPGFVMHGSTHLTVSEDPERTWRQVAPHVMHVVRSYAKFAEGTTSSSSVDFQSIGTEERVRRSGFYTILTPDEAVRIAVDAAKVGANVYMDPLIGGVDPKVGWEALEVLTTRVIPRLTEAAAGGAVG
jgi:alkanesulfonate monooxygenase SsuD/methylene tetrahydromethanopterin reductase-like flavin-dependent oxidoreductase (luciferase family)